MDPHRDERVFLVRMWLERNARQHDGWRGSIHDVASGRKFYVTGPGEVAEFITLHLNDRDISKET